MTKSINIKFSQPLLLLIFFILFCCLSGCGGSKDTDTGTTPTTPTAASLDLLASPPTVKSDGSTSSTITITAKNSSNAALSGINITMSTDTGNLSTSTVTTGNDGTATLMFSSGGGTNGPIDRTATITATTGSVSSQIPIVIVGSKVTLSASATSLTTSGTDSITLTITAKNSAGAGVNGAAVTLTQSGTGAVNIASSLGTTGTINGSSGVFTTTVTGATAGTVTVIARALGESDSKPLIVATPVDTFAIDQQTLNAVIVAGNPNPTSMVDGNNLAIRVNVPSAYSSSTIVFVSTIGTWVESGAFTALRPVVGGKATATLNTSSVGTATVQVYIQNTTPLIQNSLTVYMLSANPANSIILQATPTVVPMNTGTSTITATVRDSSVPPVVVANVPVAFSMVNPTGGGETINPVVFTGLDGKASATFKAGTLPSYDAGGVKIHAQVVGTAVATGVLPSGNDAAVVIGGVPGSIAFGMATALATTGGTPPTEYIQAMSVLVADINGNPVPAGTVVSLNVWPIAWSTGVACSYDPDGKRCDYSTTPATCVSGDYGTYLNEDLNENLILDPGEDGYRHYYYGTLPAAVTPSPNTTGKLIPPNSAGGTLPTTAITDANGVATFNLTYPKNSAIWTVVRVRASTIVQGSETVAQIIFRLPPLVADVGPPCLLQDSPYKW